MWNNYNTILNIPCAHQALHARGWKENKTSQYRKKTKTDMEWEQINNDIASIELRRRPPRSASPKKTGKNQNQTRPRTRPEDFSEVKGKKSSVNTQKFICIYILKIVWITFGVIPDVDYQKQSLWQLRLSWCSYSNSVLFQFVHRFDVILKSELTHCL